uniref:Trafficking protein, kinesin binding 2 n=1 Tax=Labrus bergylta TaxID=56723 RepID=A0A3Q3EDA7_9LABR
DSQDWAVSPSCSPDEPPGQHTAISPMLAEETFRYMILSGDRVEQMTKTYNDVEVVTHLLAERDRDLELAARIGQSLLQRNHLLQERNEALEEQLAQTLDQVHQVQHELSKKDELLRMVSSATEESETDSSASTPLRQPPLPGATTATAALSQLESLHGKLQDLEEENLMLRSEACQLKRDTICFEEKEQQLVSDCVKELRESNGQMVSLTEELSQKNEELLRHQEEIAQLLSQIVELQHRVKELALEKEELRIHLQASKDAQRQLTAELDELADRNAECLEMLHESQEEIRELRNKNNPSADDLQTGCVHVFAQDSLAAEIEGTMRRELSVEEESTFKDQSFPNSPLHQRLGLNITSTFSHASYPGSGQSSLVMTAQPFLSSQREEVRLGQPGCPGGNDLTKALHRLSLRRQNFLCERQFFQAEREKKLHALAGAEADGGRAAVTARRWAACTPRSPTCPSSQDPLEQLAKPHLATILDPHPGVVTKGFCPLAQDAVYRLSDMEEDEEDEDEELGRISDVEKGAAERGKEDEDEEEEEGGITFKVHFQHPGKCQSSTFSTYTFTTCRILHPSDVTQVTTRYFSVVHHGQHTQLHETGPSTPVTPCRLSLGDSFPPRRAPAAPCGLAKLVLERGISAQISTDTPPPSPKPTARQPLFRLLPSTPPNSPSHSPTPSPVPTESRQHSADNFLASRPAELFLQDVYGLNLGRPGRARPDPGNVGLVERLRRLGFTKVLQGAESDASVPRQDSSTFVSASGGSLLDGLRRNQSLPAMIGARAGKSASIPTPPPHPTTLALPPPSWGNLKERRRHLGSLSHASSSSAKR